MALLGRRLFLLCVVLTVLTFNTPSRCSPAPPDPSADPEAVPSARTNKDGDKIQVPTLNVPEPVNRPEDVVGRASTFAKLKEVFAKLSLEDLKSLKVHADENEMDKFEGLMLFLVSDDEFKLIEKVKDDAPLVAGLLEGAINKLEEPSKPTDKTIPPPPRPVETDTPPPPKPVETDILPLSKPVPVPTVDPKLMLIVIENLMKALSEVPSDNLHLLGDVASGGDSKTIEETLNKLRKESAPDLTDDLIKFASSDATTVTNTVEQLIEDRRKSVETKDKSTEKVEKVEKVELTEKVEKVESTEKVEKVESTEKVENLAPGIDIDSDKEAVNMDDPEDASPLLDQTEEGEDGGPVAGQNENGGGPVAGQNENGGGPVAGQDENGGGPVAGQNENGGGPVAGQDENGGGPVAGQDENGGGPVAGQDENGGGPVAGQNENGGGPVAGQNENGGGPVAGQNENGGGPIAGDNKNNGAPVAGNIPESSSSGGWFGAWKFLIVFLIIAVIIGAGYLCSHNRKKLREGVGSYIADARSRGKRARNYRYRPVNTT